MMSENEQQKKIYNFLKPHIEEYEYFEKRIKRSKTPQKR